MTRGFTYPHRSMALGCVLGFLLLPSLGEATTALIQTTGHPQGAAAGNDVPARLSVLFVNPVDGARLSDLATGVGDGSAEITLPTGWALSSRFNSAESEGLQAGPSGIQQIFCQMRPFRLERHFDGVFVIQVRPHAATANCVGQWRSGEYHYQISLDNVSDGTTTFSGSGLGVLVIP